MQPVFVAVLTITFAASRNPVLAIIVLAATDPVSVLAIIAGIAGALSGVGAFFVQRRDVGTKADDSYVERNLAAMQAYITLLQDELAQKSKALDECLSRRQRRGPSSGPPKP